MSSASLSPFPWPIVSEIGTAGLCIIRPHQQDVGDPNSLDRRMQKEEIHWHPERWQKLNTSSRPRRPR